MLDVSQDIHSLTEFKRNTTEFLDKLKVNGRALLLTINGHAELAVMSAATFQRVLDAIDMLDAAEGIRGGIADMKAGRTRPAQKFFAEMRERSALPKRLMNYRVDTTTQGEDDMRRYHDRIAFINHQPLNAQRWIDGIEKAIASLSWSPTRCPLAAETKILDLEVHELFYHSHRILFTISGQHVIVLHVRHGRRLKATTEELGGAIEEMKQIGSAESQELPQEGVGGATSGPCSCSANWLRKSAAAQAGRCSAARGRSSEFRIAKEA